MQDKPLDACEALEHVLVSLESAQRATTYSLRRRREGRACGRRCKVEKIPVTTNSPDWDKHMDSKIRCVLSRRTYDKMPYVVPLLLWMFVVSKTVKGYNDQHPVQSVWEENHHMQQHLVRHSQVKLARRERLKGWFIKQLTIYSSPVQWSLARLSPGTIASRSSWRNPATVWHGGGAHDCSEGTSRLAFRV